MKVWEYEPQTSVIVTQVLPQSLFSITPMDTSHAPVYNLYMSVPLQQKNVTYFLENTTIY